MSSILSIVKQVIFLPKTFNDGDESFYELLNKTHYTDISNEISETDIKNLLSKYPECISQWLEYSENKRVHSGWFMKREKKGIAVGFVGSNGKLTSLDIYNNEVDACAKFIKMELDLLC